MSISVPSGWHQLWGLAAVIFVQEIGGIMGQISPCSQIHHFGGVFSVYGVGIKSICLDLSRDREGLK
jgi:hypothetical protein